MLNRTLLLRLITVIAGAGFVIAACSQATIPSTTAPPLETQTATFTPVLTVSPIPSSTPLPTASLTPTLFPPLAGNKPYLIFHQNYPDPKLLIYDQDGRGRQTLELPDNENDYYYSTFAAP